jgi:hypothetical protein
MNHTMLGLNENRFERKTPKQMASAKKQAIEHNNQIKKVKRQI